MVHGIFLRTALYIGAALVAFILIGAVSLALIAAWELRGYVETRQSTLAATYFWEWFNMHKGISRALKKV